MKHKLRQELHRLLRRYPRMTTSGSAWAGPQGLVELEVVTALAEELWRDGVCHLSNLTKRPETSPPTPPDCLGRLETGALVGFEVTELVGRDKHGKSLAALNIQRRRQQRQMLGDEATRCDRLAAMVWYPEVVMIWEPAALVRKVSEIITKKDAKAFEVDDEPYDQKWLVICTDEPGLPSGRFVDELRGHRFAAPRQFDRVMFLWAWNPATDRHPWVELTWQQ